MKANIQKHKIKVAQKAEKELSLNMLSFNSGDLESLGKICNSLSTLSEFYLARPNSTNSLRVPKLMQYLRGKFKDDIVLVLNNSIKCYSYTANYITKFVRGESLHGASDNKDFKRTVLHNYVFEKDNKIGYEFQISWNFIAGPNLKTDNGNIDTTGPFVHAVTINGRRIEVSLIESIVLAIAYEFWQANTKNSQEQSTKMFVQFKPIWYEELWGKEVSQKLTKQLINYGRLNKNGEFLEKN